MARALKTKKPATKSSKTTASKPKKKASRGKLSVVGALAPAIEVKEPVIESVETAPSLFDQAIDKLDEAKAAMTAVVETVATWTPPADSLLELDSGPRVQVTEEAPETINLDLDDEEIHTSEASSEASTLAPPAALPARVTGIEGLAAASAQRNQREQSPEVIEQRRQADQERIERERQANLEREAAAKEAREKAAPVLSSTQIIIGALTGGNGAIVSWSGAGELTRAQMMEVLRKSELPIEWSPKRKSAKAQASHALSVLQGNYVVKPEKVGKKTTDREYVARWTVGVVDHTGDVGDSFGDIAITVVLNDDDTLKIVGPKKLRTEIEDEYDRRCGEEIYTSTEVGKWLYMLMEEHWGARRMGNNWYLPRGYVPAAKRIVQALRDVKWGENWFGPIPCATTDELITGIAESFISDVEKVLHDMSVALEMAKERYEVAAKAEGPRRGRKPMGVIGEEAAISFRRQLGNLAEQAIGYRVLLGAEKIEPIRKRVLAAIEETEKYMDDTSKRGAQVWDEIAREIEME
jgi:hypothetical protein